MSETCLHQRAVGQIHCPNCQIIITMGNYVALQSENEKLKLEVGDWIEKWEEAGHEQIELDKHLAQAREAMDTVLGIIVNVSMGDQSRGHPDWVEVAKNCRDNDYRKLLKSLLPANPSVVRGERG